MATFAWRLITDDLSPTSSTSTTVTPLVPSSSSSHFRKSDLNENQILQLKGIFLHYDTDRDGLLTIEQLTEALQSIGFSTRNKFLIKFLPHTTSNQMKIQGKFINHHDSKLTFKTEWKTFLSIINKEIQSLKKLDNELTSLFQFIDINHTGYLSKRELKFLLVDVLSPTRLTAPEFTKFMKSLKSSFDSNDNIRIEELKRQLILYHC